MSSQSVDGVYSRKQKPRIRSFGDFAISHPVRQVQQLEEFELQSQLTDDYENVLSEDSRFAVLDEIGKGVSSDTVNASQVEEYGPGRIQVEEPSDSSKYFSAKTEAESQTDKFKTSFNNTSEVTDPKRRLFLQLATMAGLGVLVAAFVPKKAEALILGSSPTTGVVGVKDSTDTRINPATEETLQDLLTGQSVDKITTELSVSGNVLVPASGKKIRVYSTRFSLTADVTSVGFRFTSGGTDYERYVSPKTGGLYGANNHPNFVEGGIDEALYCSIVGTATVQINLDYLEV